MSEVVGDTVTRAEFRTRSECVSCEGARLTALWGGRFDDPDIAAQLRKFHYSSDLSALADASFQLVRCDDCGMTFHQRVLTDDWLGVLYSRWIDSSQIEAFERDVSDADAARDGFEHARQDVKQVLRMKAQLDGVFDGPLRLLDFGCGDGQLLRMAGMFQFQCVGVDASESRKQRADRAGLPIYPDLATLREQDGQPFHAITLCQTLEHLADPRQVLNGLTAMMLPNGILSIAVPDCRSPVPPRSFEDFHNVQPLEHVNCFTPDTLRGFVARFGYTALARPPAHVTTRPLDVLKTEASRVWQPKSTMQYFRRTG